MKRRSIAGGALALVLAAAAVVRVTPSAMIDAWPVLEGRQLSISVRPGENVVEIADATDGWVERVRVHADVDGTIRDIAPRAVRLPDTLIISNADKAFLRSACGDSIPTGIGPRATAEAISDWVGRRAYGRRVPAAPDADPATITSGAETLREIDSGRAFNCYSLANVFCDMARAFGLPARRVDLAVRRFSTYEAHSAAEVWCADVGRWVFVDPTFSVTYDVDGVAASALDLHRAVASSRFSAITLSRPPSALAPDPRTYEINPLLYFHCVSIKMASGEPFVTLVDESAPPGPVGTRGVLHAPVDGMWAAPVTNGSVSIAVREQGGRVVAQVFAGRLYVCLTDGLFIPGRFRVRTTSPEPLETTDGTSALDLADPSIAAGDELAANVRLVSSQGRGVPDDWGLQGTPASIESANDRVTIETANQECVVSVPVRVEEKTTLAGRVRLEIERGSVSMGFRKPAKWLTTYGVRRASWASPYLASGGRRHGHLRIIVQPDTRCAISGLSVRRAPVLADLVSAE